MDTSAYAKLGNACDEPCRDRRDLEALAPHVDDVGRAIERLDDIIGRFTGSLTPKLPPSTVGGPRPPRSPYPYVDHLNRLGDALGNLHDRISKLSELA